MPPLRLLCGALTLCLAFPVWAEHTLKLGVFAYRPKPLMETQFRPLADYLDAGLEHHRVELMILDQEEMASAVSSRQVDIVFTSPSHYLVLRSVGSLTTVMATAISMQDGQAVKSLGGVIIARADRPDIQRLSDIQRLRVGFPGPTFLGGYQSQIQEFYAAGLPFPGQNTPVQLGGHDQVVRAVLAGEVDVGFIRTGVLERMTDAQGPVQPRLRVVNPQVFAGFPYASSTRLYPEWPMVALSHVDDDVVRRVASDLLALSADHPAAVASGMAGFAPALDYLPVETLARDLRLPPFDTPVEVNWHDLWQRHQPALIGGAAGLVALLVLTALLAWSNQRLNALLKEQIRTRRSLLVTASVFSSAREGIVITDPDARIIDVNQAFTDITGYTRDEVIGSNPRMFSARERTDGVGQAMWSALREQGVWEGELLNRRKSGETYHQLTTITEVKSHTGQALHYISVFTDITAQKEYEERLRRLAYFDDLTGLPNRSRLTEVVERLLQKVRRGEMTASLAYIDLDGFKEVNDHHGHHVGDRFLKNLSAQLKATLQEGDTLARLGGDEFVVVLTHHRVQPEADPRLLALLACLAASVDIDGTRLQVSGSIGVVACTNSPEEDTDHLIRLADQAMYQAKQEGRNRYRVFDRVRNVVEQDAHDMRRRMAEALTQGEFVLHYQPKVHMREGHVVGMEALIRWQHPHKGLLAPGAFLGYAMGHEIDIDIGRWVIGQALRQMKQWARLGIHLPVSVNVSGAHLQHPSFTDELHALLINHPELPPGSLELEVLESSALADVESVSAVIRRCDAMGVTVALDDFGTGYSSLTYLKRLPAKTLKIDQSFVRTMLSDREDLSILQGILGLAEAFDRQTVAEGVETAMHGLMLLQMGCEWGQGYGIARPMPAQEVPLWMAHWSPPDAWRLAQRREGLAMDVLVASVHWCEWMRQLLEYLRDVTDEPPPMADPVSPLVGALQRAHEAGAPEAGLNAVCQQVVVMAHRAVALKLAQQATGVQAYLRALDTEHEAMHQQMKTLGYWL